MIALTPQPVKFRAVGHVTDGLVLSMSIPTVAETGDKILHIPPLVKLPLTFTLYKPEVRFGMVTGDVNVVHAPLLREYCKDVAAGVAAAVRVMLPLFNAQPAGVVVAEAVTEFT